MFKVGNYHITMRGRLVKLLSEFKMADGGNISGAVFVNGQGWFPARFKVNGNCMENAEHNIHPDHDFRSFLTYCQATISYDHTAKSWSGTLKDSAGALILNLTGLDSQERTLKLLQLGAQEKVLTWMQDSGYVDDELEEGAE